MVFICPLAVAEALLEIIPLEHTSPEELIPIIEGLPYSDVVITGKGQQLVVHATPEQLATIRTLITKLDIPQCRLLISIRLTESRNQRDASVDSSKDSNIDTRANPPSEHPKLKARRYSTKKLYSGIYQVYALEGHKAFISFDQSIPHEDRQFFSLGKHKVFGRTIRHRTVSNGFLVLPRLKGDLVELEITLRQQALQKYQDEILEQTSIKTLIRGHVGQWMDVGIINNTGVDSAERQMTSSVPGKLIIQVKVESRQ